MNGDCRKIAKTGGERGSVYKPVVNSVPFGLAGVKLGTKVCILIIEDADRINCELINTNYHHGSIPQSLLGIPTPPVPSLKQYCSFVLIL